MNATAMPNDKFTLAAMGDCLVRGAQHGAVDLADERQAICCLVDGGFTDAHHSFLEAAIDRARAALQAVRTTAAGAAEASALLVLIAVWVFAYVGFCPVGA